MWEKSKGITKCEKRTVTCDIGTTQYEDGTVKCEKKVRESLNVIKKTVTCDIETAQCEDGTAKCENKK